MKTNIINKVFVGAAALSMLFSCTVKSEWDVDESFKRPFGSESFGVEVADRVAEATVTWSATPETEYYLIQTSVVPMTDPSTGKDYTIDEIMLLDEESKVFGDNPESRITKSPFVITDEFLKGGSTYYIRIMSVAPDGSVSRWVYLDDEGTFETQEETLLNTVIPENIDKEAGTMTLTWLEGYSVTKVGYAPVSGGVAGDPVMVALTADDITGCSTVIGDEESGRLAGFTEYEITIYNGDVARGSVRAYMEGMTIDASVTARTTASLTVTWEETTIALERYACTEGPLVPETPEFQTFTPSGNSLEVTGLSSMTEYTIALYTATSDTPVAYATGKTLREMPSEYGAPKDLAVMTAEEWDALSGKVILKLGKSHIGNFETLPAAVTDVIFWGDAGDGEKPDWTLDKKFKFAGKSNSIEFYNLHLIAIDDRSVIEHDNAEASISNVIFRSCVVDDFKGLIRYKSASSETTSMKMTIEDCVMNRFGQYSSSYGLFSLDANLTIQDFSIDMKQSTVNSLVKGKGYLGTFVKVASNVVTFENCTLYSCMNAVQTNGLFRYFADGQGTTFNVKNVLVAGEYGSYAVLYADENKVTWNTENILYASDVKARAKRNWPNTPLSYSTVQLMPNHAAGDLTLAAELPAQYRTGDPRWF